MPKQMGRKVAVQPVTRKTPVKRPLPVMPAPSPKKPKRALRKKNHRPVASYDGPGSDVDQVNEGYLDDQHMLGTELYERLLIIAAKRGLGFADVLRQAVQRYVESEFVVPTTAAKDEALYPPTENPLEESLIPRVVPAESATEVMAADANEVPTSGQ